MEQISPRTNQSSCIMEGTWRGATATAIDMGKSNELLQDASVNAGVINNRNNSPAVAAEAWVNDKYSHGLRFSSCHPTLINGHFIVFSWFNYPRMSPIVPAERLVLGLIYEHSSQSTGWISRLLKFQVQALDWTGVGEGGAFRIDAPLHGITFKPFAALISDINY